VADEVLSTSTADPCTARVAAARHMSASFAPSDRPSAFEHCCESVTRTYWHVGDAASQNSGSSRSCSFNPQAAPDESGPKTCPHHRARRSSPFRSARSSFCGARCLSVILLIRFQPHSQHHRGGASHHHSRRSFFRTIRSKGVFGHPRLLLTVIPLRPHTDSNFAADLSRPCLRRGKAECRPNNTSTKSKDRSRPFDANSPDLGCDRHLHATSAAAKLVATHQ